MKTSSSYLELLFENRNKEYGAYELCTHYNDRLLKAFGMALLIGAMAFLVPYILTLIFSHPGKPADIFKLTTVDLQKPFIIENTSKPLVQPATRQVAEGSYRLVKRTEAVEKPEIKKEITETSTATASATITTATSTGTETILPPETTLPLETIFNTAAVEVIPMFPGGEKALMKFLEHNIHYSSFARENNITGKVYASFIVNEKGEIINIEIKRSLEEGLDNEVVRVLKKMPSWTPGMYHGEPVKTAMIVPVFFSLTK